MKNAMHLVLDIGNTQMKYGLFANNGLALSGVCTEWTQQSWDTFFRKYPFSVVLIGSVGSSSKQVVNYLPENNLLFAALWEFERKAWGAKTGGPDSGIWRSRDGGSTWEEI